MEDLTTFGKVFAHAIHANWLEKNNTQLEVLRLDRLHNIISGNKWFKLKYYLDDAKQKGFNSIATFGGAYSNHIVATAFACHVQGLKSLGIIRGEQPPILSHTLETVQHYGMKFEFVNRVLYQNTKLIQKTFKDFYWIEEGGYGNLGLKGAKEILNLWNDSNKYSHIVCAVGTGTMMAGLIAAANAKQSVIGISVMKENYSLNEKVKRLLSDKDVDKLWRINHEFHFGGYAKHPPSLIQFMNETWQQYQLPTDIVYTSKTFYATKEMIEKNTIPRGSNVLMIHSGGLQGNLSLPEKTLWF